MKQFLEDLVKNIVDSPDQVSVEESLDEQGRTVLLISVADDDMGRVIGKSGKVINAIRTIIRIMAIRQNVRVRVDVKDTESEEEDQVEETVEPSVEDDEILVDTEEEAEEVEAELEVEEDETKE